jgi:ABC-type Fe3+/spermidine/putrescine transport system ATPase subunit
LDEPFSSLDENLRQKMRELVIALHQELNLTTVLVTHDQEEALVMSDRVAIMLDGRILQYDTPKSVYESPSSPEVANYFGQMNYIEGFVKNGYFQSFIDDSIFACRDSLDDGKYLLMLRPNQIKPLKKPGLWKVKSISYLGDKYHIWITGKGIDLFIAAASDIEVEVGDSINIELDYSKGVFYKQSREIISY